MTAKHDKMRKNGNNEYNTTGSHRLINVQTKNIAQKHIAQKLIAQNTWEENN